jgi:hypothetical protein
MKDGKGGLNNCVLVYVFFFKVWPWLCDVCSCSIE